MLKSQNYPKFKRKLILISWQIAIPLYVESKQYPLLVFAIHDTMEA